MIAYAHPAYSVFHVAYNAGRDISKAASPYSAKERDGGRVDIGPTEIIVASLVFWILLTVINRLHPIKKGGLEVGTMYLTYKTKQLNKLIKKITEKNPRLWRVMWNIGVATAVGLMILAVYSLTKNISLFLLVPEEAGPVYLLIPGVTIQPKWFPYLLIAISVAIMTHELAHGIAASVENIPIKSAGIVIAFITFGGFVEPDEKELDRAAVSSKLRVVSAGCLANLIVGLLILLLIMGLYAPASGVLITGLTEDGPAYNSGVRQWDVVSAINGTEISGLSGLDTFMSDVKPHNTLVLETSSGTKIIEADVSPVNSSKGIMGVRCVDYYPPKLGLLAPSTSYHLYLTLDWSFFLIINLSIFNMLPLYPLDGDAYVFSLLKTYMKRGAKAARVILSVLCLALLALNVGLTFMRYGLTPI